MAGVRNPAWTGGSRACGRGHFRHSWVARADRVGEGLRDGLGGLAEGVHLGRVGAEVDGPLDPGPVGHHVPALAVVDPDGVTVVGLDGAVAVGVWIEGGDDLLVRGPSG